MRNHHSILEYSSWWLHFLKYFVLIGFFLLWLENPLFLASPASYILARWACSVSGTGCWWAGPVALLCFGITLCSVAFLFIKITVIQNFPKCDSYILIPLLFQSNLQSMALWAENLLGILIKEPQWQSCIYCCSPPICRWEEMLKIASHEWG